MNQSMHRSNSIFSKLVSGFRTYLALALCIIAMNIMPFVDAKSNPEAVVERTTRPTSAPTSSPTYGPASQTVVDYIYVGTLGGTAILTVVYFAIGHYTYSTEMSGRLEKIIEEMNDEALAENEDNKNNVELGSQKADENTPLLGSKD